MPIPSAAENVEVTLRLVRTDPRVRDQRVHELLEQVAWASAPTTAPHELSGGEQRVAIARVLANRQELLLADEPTGQLDSQTGRSTMVLLQELMRSEAVTAIVARHNPMLIDLADRVIELADGRVIADSGATVEPQAGDRPPRALWAPIHRSTGYRPPDVRRRVPT